MAYVQYEWETGVLGGTPISEANLDHLETQYDEGKADLDAHVVNIGAGDGRHRWTAAKLLRGAGAAAPTEIDVPVTATREFFVPWLWYAGGDAAPAIIGDFVGIRANLATERALMNFKAPHDFTALTHCKVIVIKSTNGTIDWTVTTDFAAIGEAYNTNSDSDTQNGLAMTDTEIEEVDISAAFTGLAADDYVGVQFTLDAISANLIDILGLVFKYT